MLNPVHHGSQPDAIDRYKGEPYVMCADLYATPPHSGRGGWTWYTGEAGWMYRLSVETMLGLQLQVDRQRIAPCISAHWETYKIHYRYCETSYHITVKCGAENPDHPIRVTLDGAAVNGTGVDEAGRPLGTISLQDDHREHYVEVDMSYGGSDQVPFIKPDENLSKAHEALNTLGAAQRVSEANHPGEQATCAPAS